jgi:hypothetical protein
LSFGLLHLVATVIGEWVAGLATRLQRLPRWWPHCSVSCAGGTPWRSLTASEDQADGSTLRCCLVRQAETALLAKVHALLVGMLRGHPDLILDTCSVRAQRGGASTGSDPTG